MGDQPLEIKINLNVELWFGETNDDQEMDFNRTRNRSSTILPSNTPSCTSTLTPIVESF